MPPLPLRKTAAQPLAGPQSLADEVAEERRISCRYSVEEVKGFLSWAEPPMPDGAKPLPPSPHIPIPARAPEAVAPAPLKLADSRPPQTLAEIRSASSRLSRGPALIPGTKPPLGPASGGPAGAAPESAPAHRQQSFAPLHHAPVPDDCPGATTRPVLLLSISQTGLLVLTDVVPPPGAELWFRMAEGVALDWVEVDLKVSESNARGNLVRLVFGEQCPYDLFKDVVLGNPSARKS